MSDKNRRRHFDASEWRNNQLAQRTIVALKQKNDRFAWEHAKDSKEQLLDYVWKCAQELQHTPQPEEIIGGEYIASRLGGWAKVLSELGLSKPCGKVSSKKRRVYREELKLQTSLFRQERGDLTARKQEERLERTCAAKQKREERVSRDIAWGCAHENDSDEVLIDYVRQCAAQLGRTPYTRDVLGGEYIRRRFFGWSVMLTIAGLPLPQDMRPPSQKNMKLYLQSAEARSRAAPAETIVPAEQSNQ